MSLTELVAAAKAEGSVVVYAFTSRIATVEKEFEKAYPGIDLVPTDMSSTEMIARIKAEQQANIFKADVAYISDPPVVFGELVQKGMLEKFMPSAFASRVPAEFQQPLLANRLSTKVLMYNEQAYPSGSPVTNLWDLTTPKWKGKVVTVDPLVRGDYLDLMTEIVLRSDEMAKAYEAQFGKPIQLSSGVKSAGEQWIRDLYANDLILLKSTGDANKAIGKTGQTAPPVGFTTYSDRRDNKKEGWALQIANDVAPMSGILFTANLGLLKNAPHPAAARLLINFMMGDDTATGGAAYAPFYVPGDYATRTDIKPHPDAIPLDKLRAWRIDPAKSLTIRQQVADYILKLK
ncbi:MAG: ABC transporter substrate-binding protein [Anaerolineales bacterium]|nr:ABC transporter substrate-binding protein [Anaerolineales bacterium]